MMTIQGKCPMGCGKTLFAASGGYITCSFINCPDPNFVSVLMDQLDKIAKVLNEADAVQLT